MPNFSSLARLEVPEKFLWWVGWGRVGGVCKVIFVSNPTVVLRLGWGFDNKSLFYFSEACVELGQAQLKLELKLYFTPFKICCIKLI